MLATCDRHIKLLNLIEESPDEYSLVKSDRGETAGRNWLSKFFYHPWHSFLTFLFKKLLAVIGYVLHKVGLAKKLKIL